DARSAAILSIPSGATITYARLYWSAAGTTAAGGTTATLSRAGTGAFSSTITADATSTGATTGSDAHNYYQSTAEVTSIVQSHGTGVYRVGGIDSVTLAETNTETLYAAWWLVVFYKLS